MEQLFGLAFEQAVNGYARPGGYEGADTLGGDDHLDFGVGCLGAAGFVFLNEAEALGSELGGQLVVGALGGGLFLVQQVVGARLSLHQVGGAGLGVNA